MTIAEVCYIVTIVTHVTIVTYVILFFVFLAEKLFSAFTWHMSGIHTKSTTHIGRHISTLVRTLTAIGSDMDESHNQTEYELH